MSRVWIGAILVGALVVAACGDDSASPFATTTSTTPAVTTTAAPTSTAPSSTTALSTSTAPVTTTTTTATTVPLATELTVDGLGPLTLGMSVTDAAATGLAVWEGPSPENPDCGFVLSDGPYGTEAFSLQVLDEVVSRIIVSNPASIVTASGISPGANQAAVEAAFGPPDLVEPGMFDPSETNLYYFDGDRGFRFVFSGADVLWSINVALDTAIYLSEGCL